MKKDLDFSHDLKYIHRYERPGFSDKIHNQLKEHISKLMKFLEAYYNISINKHEEALNILKTGKSQNNLNQIDFFEYNLIGCSHAFLDKPQLSIIYFKKCLKEARELNNEEQVDRKKNLLNKNTITKTPQIVYNLALSFLKAGEYKKAISHFSKIQSSNQTNYMVRPYCSSYPLVLVQIWSSILQPRAQIHRESGK